MLCRQILLLIMSINWRKYTMKSSKRGDKLVNCLVLGGGGFLGSHLCDGLLSAGHNVRIFEKTGRSKKNIEHLLNQVEYQEGDFADENNLHKALSDMDVVFHL